VPALAPKANASAPVVRIRPMTASALVEVPERVALALAKAKPALAKRDDNVLPVVLFTV